MCFGTFIHFDPNLLASIWYQSKFRQFHSWLQLTDLKEISRSCLEKNEKKREVLVDARKERNK